MITKIILFVALLTSSIMLSQTPFPHLSPSLTSRAERVANFGVQGLTTEFLEITNSTEFANQFIPSIWAHHQADNRFVLRHFATTNSTQDNGTTPMMIFRAELRNGLNLTAPNTTGDFPWGTTSALVINRPLFAWENGNNQLMRILANGFVGIGTTTPTSLFHTNGTVRFENIPTANANTYVLTADASGNVSRQLSNSFGSGGGVVNTCETVNYLTKSSALGITCSQIFDDGTNIGIGTVTPTAKLHINNGNNSYGAILANSSELPFSLYTKTIGTGVLNGESFRLGLKYSNDENNGFISFYRGGSSIGGFLGFSTNGTEKMRLSTDGNVGIGTSSPAYKLDVNGTIRCTDLTTLSDGKYKKNLKTVNDALSSILKLEGKTYNWKREEYKSINFNDKLQYGLIAQEVEKVIPALAYKTENGEYSINYIGLIPVLIEAIKQQQTQIVALQDQLNSNFQKQNGDLINLKNTKIISVSPNPSSDVITVSLNIEESVQDAKLIVYNLNGSIMSSLNIKERATNITRTLQRDNFGSGTFIVSLYINGKSLDTKKIIFN